MPAKGSKSKSKQERKIIYKTVNAGVKKIDEDMMTQLLGATIAEPDAPFEEPLFKLDDGRTVVCAHNSKNRPFVRGESVRLANVILSKQWVLNGEPIILSAFGEVIDGQHRLIALLMAIEMWKEDPEYYADFWPECPYIDSVLVVGIDEDPTVVNTLNTGRRRKLSDALVCAGLIDAPSQNGKKLQARTLENAIKFVTQRIDWEHESFNKKRVYADDVEFFNAHSSLKTSVDFVIDCEGNKKKLLTNATGIKSLGIIAALHYFMSTCMTDSEKYDNACNESVAEFASREKADEFIASMANGEKLFDGVRNKINAIFKANPYAHSHEAIQIIIKAFHMWVDKDKIDTKKLVLRYSKPDEDGFKTCLTNEFVGGIDYERKV